MFLPTHFYFAELTHFHSSTASTELTVSSIPSNTDVVVKSLCCTFPPSAPALYCILITCKQPTIFEAVQHQTPKIPRLKTTTISLLSHSSVFILGQPFQFLPAPKQKEETDIPTAEERSGTSHRHQQGPAERGSAAPEIPSGRHEAPQRAASPAPEVPEEAFRPRRSSTRHAEAPLQPSRGRHRLHVQLPGTAPEHSPKAPSGSSSRHRRSAHQRSALAASPGAAAGGGPPPAARRREPRTNPRPPAGTEHSEVPVSERRC